MSMKLVVLCIATTGLWLSGAERAVAQTVSTSAPSVVASSQEWGATMVKDPVDMNQWTDVGWYNYSIDAPLVDLAGVSHGVCTATSGASPSTVSGTVCFKATKATSGGNVFVLDSPIPTITAELHKSGIHFPIDASTYTTIVFRMRVTSGNCVPGTAGYTVANCTTGFIWWPNSLYDPGVTTSASYFVNEGWGIYYMNIPSLGYAGTPATPWAGILKALRMNLPGPAGTSIEIDWIRLVPDGTQRTISWTGFAGAVDIYLDNNTSQADGNLGFIAKQGTVKSVGVSSSFTFDPAGLAPGTYYAKVCSAGASPTSGLCRYSSSFVVNDIPVLTFTSPSPEGSSDDFATTVLGDAWDMNALSDIDYHLNNTATPTGNGINQGLTITTISDAVDETGAAVPPFQAAFASTTALADPYMYPLWFNSAPVAGRGQTNKIDSNKYHILTIEAGIPNRARDIAAGSMSRIVWQVQGERTNGNFPRENVSGDILFNHRAGYNVLTTIRADMKTLALETDPGASPSTTGWRGNIESFRFDAYEIDGSANQPYYVKRIKLAAKEQVTGGNYTIAWSYADGYSESRTLTLSRDTDLDPSSGLVTIASGLDPATGSYAWNTSGVPAGNYYIYASYSDGRNTNAAYARWPIVIGVLANLTASPTQVNIIATKSGASLPHSSPPQEVTVTMSGANAAWTASANQPWVLIANGSGTGSGKFTVAVQNPSDVIGSTQNQTATITVTASGIGLTTTVAVSLRIKPAGTSDSPFGSFDTPVSSITPLSGSFPVTGWALDDIGIDRVEIWRDPVPGETTPVYTGSGLANGKIFIANPFFVTGARADIEAAYPTHPFAARAGWGYLLLSYGLWNQGNSPFTLYAFAFDIEGHGVSLGSKTIVVNNDAATKPFGSIDTPAYGETVSGTFPNFGWALTPNASPPCSVAGGSVQYAINSGTLQPVTYGSNRPDIAAAFPGFTDGNNGGGVVGIDTTALPNGSHQIGWYVVDSCGRADGIGSRFFSILNSGSSAVPASTAADAARAAVTAPVRPTLASVELSPVRVERHDRDWEVTDANSEGVHVVPVEEGERIEIELPRWTNVTYEGARISERGRIPLPTGSSLDAKAGVFYWQPGTGFLGAFDLEFVGTRAGEQRITKVRVVVGPSMRTAIDTPQHGQTMAQPFWVSGWTTDLAATEATGIDAVHVWAYPAGGGTPVFLGFGAFGDARPDVAAVYGRQFERSAYNVLVNRLRPGVYDIVVYPHRVATNTFEGAQVIRITIQ